MNYLRHERDEDVQALVNAVAHATAEIMKPLFMRNGLTELGADFETSVAEAVCALLKGAGGTDFRRLMMGKKLPQLLIDDAFFGHPAAGDSEYLVVTAKDVSTGEFAASVGGSRGWFVLQPGAREFTALDDATVAYKDFGEAVQAVLQFLRQQGVDLEEAKRLGLRVMPVAHVPAYKGGFVLATGRR